MNCERKRLESFKNWAVSDKNPLHLAKDGFYYLDSRIPELYDRFIAFDGNTAVRCYFCNTILYEWEFMDSIREEHKRHFSRCPLINGRPTNNIPIENQSDEYLIFRVKKSVIEKTILDKIVSEVFNHDYV